MLEIDNEAVRQEISNYFHEQKQAFSECFSLHEVETRRVNVLNNTIMGSMGFTNDNSLVTTTFRNTGAFHNSEQDSPELGK